MCLALLLFALLFLKNVQNFMSLCNFLLFFLDFATLKVTDTQLDSRAADLYLQVTSSNPLSVRANNMIHTETGTVTPIRRDVLDLRIDGLLEDVILSVLKGMLIFIFSFCFVEIIIKNKKK